MAERICPFCGKENSSEAEFCWNCRARLVPIGAGLPPPENATPEQITEWLKQTSKKDQPDSSPAQAKEEVPEWLARVRERSRLEKEAIENASSLIPNETPEGDGETPDWLNEFRAEAAGAQTPPPVNEPEHPEAVGPSDETPGESVESKPEPGDLPPSGQPSEDWISQDENIPDIFPEEPATGAPSPEKPPVGGEDQSSSTGTSEESPQKPESEPEAASPKFNSAYSKPFQTDELRKMFMDTGEVESKEKSKPTPSEPEKPANLELPSWLKDLESEVPPEPSGKAKAESPFSSESPLEESTISKGEESTEKVPSENAPVKGQAPSQPPPPPQNPNPPVEPSWAAPSPFDGGNLPEWLKPGESKPQEQDQSQVPAEQSTGTSQDEKEPDQAGSLEPATLPPWLKSMRPLESAMPENLPAVPQSGEESRGPLAGINNALPGGITTNEYIKPAAVPGGLQVTDRQRIHAQVLESVLKPAVVNPQDKGIKRDRSRIWQILVSLLLMLILLGKIVFSNINLTPLPTVYPSGVMATRNYLLSLPENSLVLLVAEFEPSLSGELKLASQPVLEQLMLKQIRIAIVSTQPNGDVLAMNILAEAQSRHPDYSMDEKIVDLGYLAGGAIGLQNFASLPAFSFQNTLALNSPVLAGGLDWKNFGGIVILTDGIENARLWIEQVLPFTGNIPAIMVASAQAAPVVSPYVDSGQIKGLITGIEGGVLLSQQLNLPGTAKAFSDPYQIGILFLVVFIILGGIIQAISARRPEKPEKQEGRVDADH